MLDRYNTIGIVAATYVAEDSLVTCTNKFSKNPNLVGRTWKFTYSINGDNLHWKVLNKNGAVINEGDSKRVKD